MSSPAVTILTRVRQGSCWTSLKLSLSPSPHITTDRRNVSAEARFKAKEIQKSGADAWLARTGRKFSSAVPGISHVQEDISLTLFLAITLTISARISEARAEY